MPPTTTEPPRSSARIWIAAVVLLVLAAIVFLPPLFRPLLDRRGPYERCIATVLVQNMKVDEHDALSVAESLSKLAGGDGALTVTRQNRSDLQARALGDDAVREALRGCLSANGKGLPPLHARATVRVHSTLGRAVRNAKVQLKGDAAQACTTGETGACDLTLIDASRNSFALLAEAPRLLPATQTVTLEQFTDGAEFALPSFPRLVVVVTRAQQAVRDAYVVLDAGSNFPVWSSDCQETSSDQDCDRQRTDADGQATFYHREPFRSLTLRVSVNGRIERDLPVPDAEHLPQTYRVSLDEPRSGSGSGSGSTPKCPKSVLDQLRNALAATQSAGSVTAYVSTSGSIDVTRGDDFAKVALKKAKVGALPRGCVAHVARP